MMESQLLVGKVFPLFRDEENSMTFPKTPWFSTKNHGFLPKNPWLTGRFVSPFPDGFQPMVQPSHPKHPPPAQRLGPGIFDLGLFRLHGSRRGLQGDSSVDSAGWDGGMDWDYTLWI